MFSHVVLGSNDCARSRIFYDAALGALGAAPATETEEGRLIYAHGGALFMVVPPIDGQPATYGNGGTIGFAAANAEQVDAWHAAGMAHGGSNAADPPGVRQTAYGPLYLAYLRDPDGNKLAAVHRPAG